MYSFQWSGRYGASCATVGVGTCASQSMRGAAARSGDIGQAIQLRGVREQDVALIRGAHLARQGAVGCVEVPVGVVRGEQQTARHPQRLELLEELRELVRVL